MYLEFHKQAFADLLEGGLCVMARGLGLLQVVEKYVQLASDSPQCTFVLNCSAAVAGELVEGLGSGRAHLLTAETPPGQRQALYLAGGVFFVSGRILVVDLLLGRVPPHLLAGLLLLQAHRLTEAANEAFAIRLARQAAPAAVVRAFTDHPDALTRGFGRLEKVLRWLGLQRLCLWPRFHRLVQHCLEQEATEVVELAVPLSPAQAVCQQALTTVMSQALAALKAGGRIDPAPLTLDRGLFASFDRLLGELLSPLWHEVGPQTKRLADELREARELLTYLVTYDCVAFLRLLESLAAAQAGEARLSSWLLTDEAHRLFQAARARVHRAGAGPKRRWVPRLEPQPKWQALLDVLAETAAAPGETVIIARDERAVRELRELLCDGPRVTLARAYRRYLAAQPPPPASPTATPASPNHNPNPNSNPNPNPNPPEEQIEFGAVPAEGQGQGLKRTADQLDPGQEGEEEGEAEEPLPAGDVELQEQSESEDEGQAEARAENPWLRAGGRASQEAVAAFSEYFQLLASPHITVQPAARPLARLPKYVILYEPDTAVLRAVEVARAAAGRPVRVYLLIYEESVEAARWRAGAEAETEAFKTLIRAKAGLLVSTLPPVVPSGRRVLVDMREFRAALPPLLHQAGFALQPITLAVGDYVLSPRMAVERKALADLVASLANGRLHRQATELSRLYPQPLLLIEFDGERPFGLLAPYEVPDGVDSRGVLARLALLLLAHPRLRLLWARSPHEAVRLIERLKHGRPEPEAVPEQAPPPAADLPRLLGLEQARTPPHLSLADLCALPAAALRPYSRLALHSILHRPPAAALPPRRRRKHAP